MTTALLSTTYFGPVQWYQKLYRHDHVLLDVHEHFLKQTYRNRCLIATTQGVQALTVPVERTDDQVIGKVRLSEHGNWRHQHWQAISSAYGDSPFFQYYEDDLRPFFFSHEWELLVDYNEAIRRAMCSLLDIQPRVDFTTEYLCAGPFCDYRSVISPKHPLPDDSFTPRRYWQVFEQKHGFLPNMSILDLLCNMGPESVFYL